MTKKLTALAALLLLAVLLPGAAFALGAGEVADGVQKKYSALNDLSASFNQESRVVTLGRSRFKEGTILFKKPGRMRWDYSPPDPQLIVSDGETLWYYRQEQKQVFIRNLGSVFAIQTPLLFLFGEGRLADQFLWEEKELTADGEGTYLLEMTPRSETPDLVSLALAVREGDFSIAATVLTDAFGNVTRLDFSEERENQGLEEGPFTFEVPEGSEVIRQ
jgi:outer membrane lipoprotein carrier protein